MTVHSSCRSDLHLGTTIRFLPPSRASQVPGVVWLLWYTKSRLGGFFKRANQLCHRSAQKLLGEILGWPEKLIPKIPSCPWSSPSWPWPLELRSGSLPVQKEQDFFPAASRGKDLSIPQPEEMGLNFSASHWKVFVYGVETTLKGHSGGKSAAL